MMLSSGVRLWCACAIPSLLLVGLAGCGQAEKPPATPKFQVADSNDPAPNASGTNPAGGASTASSANPAAPGGGGSIPADPMYQTRSNPTQPAGSEVPAPPSTVEVPLANEDGTPLSPEQVAQLENVLMQLNRARPQGNSEQEVQQSFLEITSQRILVAEQIVSSSSNEEKRLAAMEVAFEAASMLQQFGSPAGEQILKELSRKWSTDTMPAVAKSAQSVMFQLATADLVRAGGKDSNVYFEFVDKFLSNNKDEGTFDMAQQACLVLAQSQLPEEAKGLRERLATVFADEKNPHYAQALKTLDESLWLTEARFMDTFQDLLQKKEGAEGSYREFLAKMTTRPGLGVTTVANLTSALFALERTHPELAKETAIAMEEAFKENEDPRAKEGAKDAVAGSRKRLALVGQPLKVEGLTSDGKLFQWEDYQGKVVLIDFWATWCVPCLQELPNIEENYLDFHGQGFEVVGINLDDEPEKVKGWLQAQPLPWTTVFSADENNSGFKTPLAVECGVEAIPFVLLVGKDGNVDSIHVRGPALRERLVELLGPPQQTPANIPTESPTEKPAEKPAESAATGDSEAPADKPADLPSDLNAPANTLRPAPAEQGTSESAGSPSSESPAAAEATANPTSEKESTTTSQATVASSVSFLAEGAAPAAEATETKEVTEQADGKEVNETKEEPNTEEQINPYSAKPGLSNAQLVDYLQKMEDKPKTIRRRDEFTWAVVEACERICANDPTASEAQYAVETTGMSLHTKANEGNEKAQKLLAEYTAQWQNDTRPRIARLVDLFRREADSERLVEGSAAEIQAGLKSLQEYFAAEKLEARHLRLASNTVALINRLEDEAARQEHYKQFGELYAKSRDRELARYGKKLAKGASGSESDLVGQSFEFAGTTIEGGAFAMESLRGKVVVVDFWATWCGPCRREMPNVRAIYEKHQAAGLEIVGISLDEDEEALKDFLQENDLPWPTIFGEANAAAAEKYQVRGIPTLILLDREGKIVQVAHSIDRLEGKLQELLQAK